MKPKIPGYETGELVYQGPRTLVYRVHTAAGANALSEAGDLRGFTEIQDRYDRR